MVRKLPVNIWPRRNLKLEQDPARLRSLGQLAVKCTGLQTTRCFCFILMYLRTSSTFPGFLINCWASLPVPQPVISASRAWLRGYLRVPKGINHPSATSSISLFPPGRWANHSIMFLQVYHKIISTRATKQNRQTEKNPIASTWDSLFSLPGQLFNTPVTRVFLHLPRQWFFGEVGSIAAHGSTSWTEFHQALPLTPRWAPEAGAQGLPSPFSKKSS